ncbi:MAG: Site-specific recombinase XerD [Naasia sp.]|nr:Site-specific recombinase XerD [Naasia sp.]
MAVDQLPSGKWRARVYASGRIIATRTFTLKTDARTWEAEQVRQLAMGTYLPPARGKLTLGELAEQWMKARANAVATSTLREEGYSLAYLPPTLRDRPMAALRPAHFDALYATLLGKLARSTVSRFRNTLSSMFGWAVREGRLSTNPVLASRVPRGSAAGARREVYPFAIHELRAVHAVQAHRPDLADVVLVLGLTGIRWEELRGLRVRDVQHVPYPALRVSRSWPDGEPVRNVTKGGGALTVPLAAELLPLIEQRSAGKAPEDVLFSTPAGTPYSCPNFKRDARWMDLAFGRRIHDLRHTAATLWLGAGIDLKTTQAWLGHSSAKLTADLYAHWMGTDAECCGARPVERDAERRSHSHDTVTRAYLRVLERRSPGQQGDADRGFSWWALRDSNPRHPRCKRGALTN